MYVSQLTINVRDPQKYNQWLGFIVYHHILTKSGETGSHSVHAVKIPATNYPLCYDVELVIRNDRKKYTLTGTLKDNAVFRRIEKMATRRRSAKTMKRTMIHLISVINSQLYNEVTAANPKIHSL